MLGQKCAHFVVCWIVKMHENLLGRTINSLELESQQRLFEGMLIIKRNQMFSFASDLFNQGIQIFAMFLNKFMSLFEAYTLDRVDVITARENASNQERV